MTHQHCCPRCGHYWQHGTGPACIAPERAVCLACQAAPPSEGRPVPFGASAVR